MSNEFFNTSNEKKPSLTDSANQAQSLLHRYLRLVEDVNNAAENVESLRPLRDDLRQISFNKTFSK
ncbi:MAG: hypothetical protein ACON5A_00180 [Candidatus Comchoanobacterales bacterium]